MKKILYIIVSVAMLTGCSKELPDEPTTPEQGEQVEVTFGASLTPESVEMAMQQSAESPASRAQVPFDQPQHGCIFVLDKSGKLVEDINPIKLNIATGGAITTDPEKVILTAGTQYTFRSVVASADYPLITSISVPIYSLLNKEGEYPDLLYATATQTVTVGAQVKFAYNHIYGKVKFVLSKGENVTDDQLKAATLQVGGYYPEGAFNITTGKITTEPFKTPVSVEREAIYYAIPQTFTSGAEATAKVTTANGKTYIGKITKGDIKANKLTTITIKVNVEEPAAPIVGDFYMKNGTWISGSTTLSDEQKAACIGIVFKADRDNSDTDSYTDMNGTTMSTIHGYVVALQDVSSGGLTWANKSGEYNFSVGTSTSDSDWKGYSNCQTINKYTMSDWSIEYFQAANACLKFGTAKPYLQYAAPASSSGWFLPSCGQLSSLYNSRDILSGQIDKLKTTSGYEDIKWLTENYYWSSSEYTGNSRFARIVYFSSGYVNDGYKYGNHNVRSVLAF